MDSIELTFLLTALIGVLLYVFLVFNFNYWKKRGIDGPKPRPLLGNMPNMITQSRNFIYDIDDIYREYKFKDRFAGMFSIRTPQLLITDPKLCQEVMVANFKSFHDNEFGKYTDKDTDPVLGRNPFFLNGEEWKEKRAEITPALTVSRIKASYPIIQSICSKMTIYLEKEARNPPKEGFNGKELAAKFTTEVVSNCIYGVDAGAFSEEKCEIRENGAAILDNSFMAMLYFMLVATVPAVRYIWKRPMVPSHITDFFTKLMKEAVRMREETKSDRVDFLNYIIQLRDKKNYSEIEMAAQSMTFFIDGFETSSIAISNCLHALAEHPDIQQKLRNELNEAYDDEGKITFEKLLELPYLDQCLNESLRMRPPLGVSNKMCTQSCELRNKKDKIVKIEKDIAVLIPHFSMHNDPEYYPNPDRYDPERFSEENGGVKKYKDMGVFNPFGDGPRICLGMRFAVCQTKASIAEVIRNWQITVNPKTKSKFTVDPKQFLTVPDGGIWLNFQKL